MCASEMLLLEAFETSPCVCVLGAAGQLENGRAHLFDFDVISHLTRVTDPALQVTGRKKRRNKMVCGDKGYITHFSPSEAVAHNNTSPGRKGRNQNMLMAANFGDILEDQA